MDLNDIRTDYAWGALEEDKIASNPIEQFKNWFEQYTKLDAPDNTAMVLSTVGKDLMPQSRVVLLKEIAENQFVFFTNYASTKGQNIAENNQVSLLFFWPEMERQVRVLGKAHKLSAARSTAYFNKRPFESRVSAIVSPQSKVVPNRAHLEEQVFRFLESHKDEKEVLQRPESWGGYGVEPIQVEFWQGRISRLHDRLRYRKEGNTWKVERLAP